MMYTGNPVCGMKLNAFAAVSSVLSGERLTGNLGWLGGLLYRRECSAWTAVQGGIPFRNGPCPRNSIYPGNTHMLRCPQMMTNVQFYSQRAAWGEGLPKGYLRGNQIFSMWEWGLRDAAARGLGASGTEWSPQATFNQPCSIGRHPMHERLSRPHRIGRWVSIGQYPIARIDPLVVELLTILACWLTYLVGLL